MVKESGCTAPARPVRVSAHVGGSLLPGRCQLAPARYDVTDRQLVDGDPIANITLVDDPAKNFLVIVKDGKDLQEPSALTCWPPVH
jgi:hypothetical protein